MHIFVMQYNCLCRFLVAIDNEQSIIKVSKTEKCKFEEAYLVLKPNKTLSKFIEKSCMRTMTEVSRACDSSDFDSNTTLVGSDDIGCNEYVFFSGFELIKFTPEEKVIHFIYLMGNNMILCALAFGEKYAQF